MTERTRAYKPAVWALSALFLGTVVQIAQAQSLGGWSALLSVGQASPTRFVIAEEIPGLILTEGDGHDGQTTYAIGLDLLGERIPAVLPEAGYRYRRILMPAVASGMGAIDGVPLLISLTTLATIGFAAGVVALSMIANDRGIHPLAPLAAILNVGLWLSLQITTPDTVAFGLGMLGLVLFLRKRHLAAPLVLALAALTKETYALIALGIALYRWRSTRDLRHAVPYVLTLVPMLMWWLFVGARLPGGWSTGGNLTLPFVGLLDAAPKWQWNSMRDMVLLGLIFVFLAASIPVLANRGQSVWKFLILPWLVLASVSSHWIWDLGNNALRAFLPVVTFVIVGLLERPIAVQREEQTCAARLSERTLHIDHVPHAGSE